MTEDGMDHAPTPDARGWHTSSDLLDRYAGAELDLARAASVEQHLLACSGCRALLAGRVAVEGGLEGGLETIWLDVLDDIDRPRRSRLADLVRRAGLPDRDVELVRASPGLRWSWIASLLAVLVFAAVAASAASPEGVVLVVAPLIPLLGIAGAYGSVVDSLHELTRAAPISAARVFLLRSLAVLATAIPVLLVASLVLPIDRWAAVGWLAPSLGLAGMTLALSTWVSPRFAASVAATSWIAGIGAAWLRANADVSATASMLSTFPFQPAGQAGFLLAALTGVLVFWSRRVSFDDPDLVRAEVWR
jgi:hypothetical protein